MLLAAPVFAVEKHAVEKRYEKATITDVQQKINTRILYYVVNTPITRTHPVNGRPVRRDKTIEGT